MRINPSHTSSRRSIRVVLLNPETEVPGMRAIYEHHENLGLGLVAACLQAEGFEVDLIDQRVHKLTDGEVVQRLCRADLVGISANYVTLEHSLKLAEAVVLAARPQVIALGGEHTTYLYSSLLQQYPSVDIIVRGEGEETFLALARSLEHGTPVSEVAGLAMRSVSNGDVVCTAPRGPIPDLDQMPHADRSVAVEAIRLGLPVEVGVLLQRGCPYTCSFCNAHSFLSNDQKSRVRRRPPEDVVDELEALGPLVAKTGKMLRFYDATFVTPHKENRSWIGALCAELERRGIALPFEAFLRADSFNFEDAADLDLLRRLRRVGLVSSYLGLEAGDDETLSIYRKGIVSNRSEHAFLQLKRMGVAGATNGFMTFHQATTLPQIRNCVLFLERLGLCTFWNVATRAETLPGIALEAQMALGPRRTAWDVANYEFSNEGVAKLYDLVCEIQEIYSWPRLEDELCRRLREAARVRAFYGTTLPGLEKALDRDILATQKETLRFFLETIASIELGATPRASDQTIARYASTLAGGLRRLRGRYGFVLEGPVTEPCAASGGGLEAVGS